MNLPTKITVSRIILIILMLLSLFVLSFIPFSQEQINALNLPVVNGGYSINLIYIITCGIFVIASLTDFIDGYLARKNNLVTDFGKFLDPVADKLLVDGLIIFLLVKQTYSPDQIVFPLFCAIIMISRDLVVDALRFIAASKNVVLAANIFGKLKTILQMIAIPAILLNDWPFSYFDYSWPESLRICNIIVYAATFVSLLSGIIYLVQNKKVFKNTK